ncbi:MAG TPA: EAL domain-containing protein [Acidimicrobiales bacterium]|nr:EAL domain-containing protein [Acidimicrobiales bacterium]
MIDTASVDTSAGSSSELALLGERLQAHSKEVANAVLDWWLARHPESKRTSDMHVRDDILRTTCLGATTLGRFLVTGQLPSSKERDDMAAPGAAPLHDTISIGELTKLYLAWRDITCERLALYATQLGVGKEALRSAQDIARVGSDSSIVNVIRQFDAAHRRLREQLAHNAVHDGLTGLPNRTLLVDRLDQLVGQPHRRQRFAALFIDIDRFKSVNDLAGHATGDELLIAVATRLRGVVRVGDTIARLGGDEFVILCPDLADPLREASAVAERVTAVIGQPFHLGDPPQDFYVSASVGVGLAAPGDSAESLLSRADAAMYAAKNRGGCGHQIYDESVDRSIKRRPELLNDLHGAADRGEISIHYQPVVDLASGDVVCMEALARWHHPQFGPVRPDEFIPLAEESGVINGLGRWVLSRALRDCARWRRAGRPGVGVAVNVSGRQLGDEGLAEYIAGILAETGLKPSAVTLEITESVIVTVESAAQRVLRDLKATGVRLSIDDFGTGYSSLAYLRCLPIDVLKVDRSFVSGLGEEGRDTAIVTAMVELAHSLKLAVVAEGVETPTELEMVKRAGCDEAQGYLLGRPEPPAQSCAND